MKRETTISKRLKPFKIDTTELSKLINELLDIFESPKDITLSVAMEFGDIKFTFDNVDEIKQIDISEKTCSRFEITMFGGGTHLTLNDNYIEAAPEIRVSSNSASVCTALYEHAKKYLEKHKYRYHLFARRIIFGCCILSLLIVFILLLKVGVPEFGALGIGLIAAIFLTKFLYPRMLNWFPGSLIYIIDKPNFRKLIHNLSPVVTMVCSVIGLLVILIRGD